MGRFLDVYALSHNDEGTVFPKLTLDKNLK